VLDLIAGGEPTRGIARSLAISEFTVKRHVQNMLHKLEMRSRAEAASFYRRALGTTELLAVTEL
jgi:DNA-binding NarL/FixJ family response regulator